MSNARIATGDFANAVDLSVYLKTDVPLAKARAAREERARSARTSADVTLIPADKALEEFRTTPASARRSKCCEENPLPHVLHVHPAPEASTAGGARIAAAVLRGVARSGARADRLGVGDALQRHPRRACARVLVIAAALLGVGVLAVIGNTIRLEILNRRAEIEVTKLVGGSNGFVRRPFLYTGMLYGLGGALLAWAHHHRDGRCACASQSRRWRSSTAASYALAGPGDGRRRLPARRRRSCSAGSARGSPRPGI